MNKAHNLLITVLSLLFASIAVAQSPTQFLSIPSSSFTPRASAAHISPSYDGNESGTSRLFGRSFTMFAPLDVPNGATITSMRCGGRAPNSGHRVIFTLRRNEPQQANVDMAVVMTAFEENGFQFVDTNSVTSPVADNARFNYYIIAAVNKSASANDVGFCPDCAVGFCRLGYTAAPSTATASSSLQHQQFLEFTGFTVENGVYRLKPGGWKFRPQQDGTFVVARDNDESGGTIEPCECALTTGGTCAQASMQDESGDIVEIWCVDEGCGFCVGGTTADPAARSGRVRFRVACADRLLASTE